MLELSCHCGGVRITLGRPPGYVNECNCTLCSKAGARWGYFDPAEVAVEGDTAGYSRRDKGEPSVTVRFCPVCGATTHFRMTPAAAARFATDMTGVNMRLAPDTALAGVELRFPDGLAWTGEGAFGQVRPPVVLG